MKIKELANNLKRVDYIILVCILFVALSFRLYKTFGTPLTDFHSWRQADTAAVARNFVRNGFDLLHPKYDDLSNIQSGKDNPNGYRFVEFPIYNALMAAVYKIAPILPIEVYGRLISIFFALVTIAIIYYLLFKEHSRVAAIIGSLTFATFPFFVFFTRIVLPDITALGFSFIAIFFLYCTVHYKTSTKQLWLFYILSLISFTMAILIKPPSVFYGIPLIYLFWVRNKFQWSKYIPMIIFFIIAVLPTFLWRKYIQQFPEGIPANNWLITSVNTYQGLQVIFFRPAFFRWIFFERINNIIFGGYLTLFFVLGTIIKLRRIFLHTIFLAAFLYLFVFQGGNVQHEYYQIMILPVLAMFVGLGSAFLINNAKLFISQLGVYLLLFILFAFSFFMSYYHVKDYYSYSFDLVNSAKIIDSLTQPNDKVITDNNGDTTFLYLIDRKGAPVAYKDLDEMKNEGYSYYVSFNKSTIDNTKEKYHLTPIFENDKFALFKL